MSATTKSSRSVMKTVFRFKDLTLVLSIVLNTVFGLALLWFAHEYMGIDWYNNFAAIIKYYVLLGYVQKLFIGVKRACAFSFYQALTGFFGCGLLYNFNQMILEHFSDSKGDVPKQITFGHSYFVVIAFCVMSMDTLVFRRHLSKFTNNDFLQILIWFLISYVIWYFIYITPFIGEEVDGHKRNLIYASLGWFMSFQFITEFSFQDVINNIKWLNRKHFLIRGLILIDYLVLITLATKYISYYVSYLGWNNDEMSKTERWYHVVDFGTYPLLPSVLMSLYSESCNNERRTLFRYCKRWGYIVVSSIAIYFIYHIYIVPMGFLGHDGDGEDNKWFKYDDSTFIFCLLALPLTHHFYFCRFGFLKKINILPNEDGTFNLAGVSNIVRKITTTGDVETPKVMVENATPLGSSRRTMLFEFVNDKNKYIIKNNNTGSAKIVPLEMSDIV
eukprot:TRINITY_DN7194_c0_g1_i1.p1 TRINITY_DN7194_c0_g1~~TRINITY_DN7194_c0_g1_i1.p1  ORF type:complete len:445 (-),score=45.52 TRINITY_DN7194_c0_g1_i1:106-1440(-)